MEATGHWKTRFGKASKKVGSQNFDVLTAKPRHFAPEVIEATVSYSAEPPTLTERFKMKNAAGVIVHLSSLILQDGAFKATDQLITNEHKGPEQKLNDRGVRSVLRAITSDVL